MAAMRPTMLHLTARNFQNPSLQWDGKTQYARGRSIQKALGWDLDWSSQDTPPEAPTILHDHTDQNGLKFDFADRRLTVTLSQKTTIYRGLNYVILSFDNHVTYKLSPDGRPPDPYSVVFYVKVGDQQTEMIPLPHEKGSYRFGVLVVSREDTTEFVSVTYQTRWGNTRGELRLQRIDMSRSALGADLKWELTLPSEASPQPNPDISADELRKLNQNALDTLNALRRQRRELDLAIQSQELVVAGIAKLRESKDPAA